MNSKCIARAALRLAVTAFAVGAVVANAALPQRTFVASTGIDAHTAQNCSLASPCRSFGAAMTVTADNGEIVVLDSAGYGPVTIDRSVSIIAPAGVHAGISVPASGTAAGVTITTGSRVTLRGLVIGGQGGDMGIDAEGVNGIELTVENCVITSLLKDGIHFASTNGRLRVTDTIIRRNKRNGLVVALGSATIDNVRIEDSDQDNVSVVLGGRAMFHRSVITGSQQNGVSVLSTSSLGIISGASFDDVSISDNAGSGVFASAFGVTNQTRVTIARSTISRNGGQGVSYGIGPEPGAQSWMFVNATEITDNGGTGFELAACGPLGSAVGLISHSQIAHNNVGLGGPPSVPPPGCQLRTNGTNQVRANGTVFTGVITPDPGD